MRVSNIPESLPKRTLAWHILQWCSKYLIQPDGENAGQLFKFTREQVLFLLHFYSCDEQYKPIYNKAVIRRMRGAGKTPFLAALSIIELLAPTRPCKDGSYILDPFGKKHPKGERVKIPWVQIAATSQKQCDNTFLLIRSMLAQSRAVHDYNLDVLRTMIQFIDKAPGRIEPVTASHTTLVGGRPTFVVADETWLWTDSNSGHYLFEVLQTNLAKQAGGWSRMVQTTNAHIPGYDSVAEREYQAYLDSLTYENYKYRTIYDSIEAPPNTKTDSETAIVKGIEVARGDAHWVDPKSIALQFFDKRNEVSALRRSYFNQIVAPSDRWLSVQDVDRIIKKDRPISYEESITLGFDGSRKEDATALVGCTINDPHIFLLGVWDNLTRDKNYMVPRDEVNNTVEQVLNRYNVVGFYADLYLWEAYIDLWHQRYSDQFQVKASATNSVSYDLRTKHNLFIKQIEYATDLIRTQMVTVQDHPILLQHFKNARLRPVKLGVDIAKESRESKHKIDCAIAAILALTARREYMNRNTQEQEYETYGLYERL